VTSKNSLDFGGEKQKRNSTLTLTGKRTYASNFTVRSAKTAHLRLYGVLSSFYYSTISLWISRSTEHCAGLH